ncbi:hypothetical protein JVX98_13050 [Ensifer sp. PDNC004]|uniref:hypothetical protein n=1 Tax=Ensifer sp. PDNC004 TaxID=2811423 RepID=UPI0019629206|nr:hypothetical protein [Ensifer sp. PDNC004]QRY69145.1 hypothetical protein JVX98_13050 [Ensifer sp. PDNC004]
MSAAKHTPGPWTFGVRRDKSMWLSIGDPAKGPHYQADLYASEDDARLIVAAPELLLNERKNLATMQVSRLRLAECGRPTAELDIAIEQTEAMIAKAEGRP